MLPRSIGYARCSTTHQNTDAQVTELRSAGCQEVFAEKVSSRAPLEKRPQLRRCLESLQEGDELVVSKLDRLGRSQVEVINRLSDLQTKGIYVRTLDGLINTRGLGKLAPLVIGLLTGLAEVERSLIQERTRESVEQRLVVRLRDEGESYRSIRDQTGLSLATIQRILKDHITITA
jgi:DNA invertase Pin-like site-specific DNA recombinase